MSLAVNIVIPVIILVRFSGEDELGPVNGLLLALAFPVGYGLYDLIARGGFDPVRLFRALVRRKRPYDFIHWRRFNPYSILGFVSVLLTGGIGLLKLPVEWLAIKEAAIPFIICAAVVISMRTPYPLVKTIMHKVINVERVYGALNRRQSIEAYERRVVAATYMIAFGLLVSTVLNYVLARVVVVSEPGHDGLQRRARTDDGAELSGHHRSLDNHPRICAILPRQRHHERDGAGVPGHLQDDTGRRMNLIIAGCEYSGTTTLANGIAEWARRTMAGTQEIHDHFKIPHIACYRIGPPAEPLTDEELGQIMSWTPKMKEMAQRQSMNYHMPNTCAGDDYIVVGFHVEDAVYAAPFFGYGHDKEPQGGLRWKYARHLETEFMEQAPDTVLVYVKASAEVIAERMARNPHPFSIVQKKDIEPVLADFETEYERSVIHSKIVIDTSVATVEESVDEMRQAIQPHLTIKDRRRMVVRGAA